MTDLYLCVAHVSEAPIRRERSKQNRVPKCQVHCHGQFAVDACPYCQRSANNLRQAPYSKTGRFAARVAALEILKERTPSSLAELARLIKERCGTDLTPIQVSDMLQKLRGRGFTKFYFKPERVRCQAVEASP